MNKLKKISLTLTLLMVIGICKAQTPVTFMSRDSVTITADLYKVDDDTAPFMILFHQAGYSRGEYNDIAKKLNKLGYNCLAVDLRAGGEINGVKNETAASAKEKNKPVEYLNAEQDMVAAVNYVHGKYKRKIILWGSSYSASLALSLAKDKKIAAVIAFSPGEYFGEKLNLTKNISFNFDKPIFVTSTLTEAPAVTKIIKEAKSLNKIQFIPQREGVHGSSALWSSTPNNQEYWLNLKEFLNSIKEDMWK